MSKKSISKTLQKAVARFGKIQEQKRKQQIKARIKEIKSQEIVKSQEVVSRNIFIKKINIKENIFFKER